MSYVYVASSWRNKRQQQTVDFIRSLGFEVYDFKNPPNRTGFSWSEIDPCYNEWNKYDYVTALGHPYSDAGFKSDMDALMAADIVVLDLPCNRSAHLELGYAVGAGKKTYILLENTPEPELMYKMVTGICLDYDDLCRNLMEN